MVRTQGKFRKIYKEIQQLSDRERIKLLETLKRMTWEERFKRLVADIRAKARKNPVSDEEIDAIVEEVRAELYAERHP